MVSSFDIYVCVCVFLLLWIGYGDCYFWIVSFARLHFARHFFWTSADHFFFLPVSTPPRVYRLVASLMGLQLVTSFINVAKMLGAQRETTRRQLDAEKKKRHDGPRVESLDKRYNMTHDKITILEEMMRKIFTGYVTGKRIILVHFKGLSANQQFPPFEIRVFNYLMLLLVGCLCIGTEILILIFECRAYSHLVSGFCCILHYSCRICT